MKRIWIYTALFFFALMLACGCSQAKSIDEQMQAVRNNAEVLKEMGLKGMLIAHLPTRAGWHTKSEIGSDGDIFVFLQIDPESVANSFPVATNDNDSEEVVK
jgi:regulator of extracellular matrix RemA (YlzA/DUF370 family)